MNQSVVKTKRVRGRALQQARMVKLNANPLCEHCESKGLVTLAAEVDHIVPLFKGGLDTFEIKQSLCKECHRVKTSKDMGHKVKLGCDVNGFPVDQNHHWNKTK